MRSGAFDGLTGPKPFSSCWSGEIFNLLASFTCFGGIYAIGTRDVAALDFGSCTFANFCSMRSLMMLRVPTLPSRCVFKPA